jgi:hypothetical protein
MDSGRYRGKDIESHRGKIKGGKRLGLRRG